MTVSSVTALTSLAYYKLRDKFAGQAMASLISTPLAEWPDVAHISLITPESVSEVAYALADAMLAVRMLPRKDQK